MRSVMMATAAAVTVVLAATAEGGGGAAEWSELSPARVEEIAAMLPAGVSGPGRPITDRAYWTSASVVRRAGWAVAEAERLLGTEMPAWVDEDYLEFSRTGRRAAGEAMMSRRHGRLSPLVLAECVEGRGRFVGAINAALREYVAEPTWTLPAHDAKLNNFRGTSYDVDLGSAVFAADLGQALWLLGDRVEPEVREAVVRATRRRVFEPVERALRPGGWAGWLGSVKDPVKNNWNAVCLAGVTSAALAMLEDRGERAVFVAAGEHYVRYFLNGIRPSGYCDEGGGYWAYGFGLFMHLRESLVRATGGRVELLELPRAKEGALFGPRYTMTDGLMPTFADSRHGTRAEEGMVNFCLVALGAGGDAERARLWRSGKGGVLCTALVEPTAIAGGAGEKLEVGPRSWFEDVGVLVCRPSGAGSRLGFAVKNGGNTSHSHNDVGSWVVSVGGEIPLGDPGGPMFYDNRTFTQHRFERKLLSSYGHPVPLIDGKEQLDATRVKAAVLKTAFGDDADEVTIDMKPAYDVAGLKSYRRTARYERAGRGAVVVRDEFEFAGPTAVEMALPYRGKAHLGDLRRLRFEAGGEAVTVEVRAPCAVSVKEETFTELGVTFHRAGLRLEEKITSGVVEMVIRPEE